MITRFLAGTAFTLALAMVSQGQVDVTTFHNDLSRTGQNLGETLLSPALVRSSTFAKLYSVQMDGKVDAQPLYVSGLLIPGKSIYNVVYAATEHDSVYAFDASNGHLLWHVSLLGGGETTSDARGCDQVVPEIGITATPVIDRSAGPHGTIYVVAMSKDGSGHYYHRLHALDLTSGAEQFDGPRTVSASYPTSNGGSIAFDPKQYKDRPGLMLLNGVVYTSWGSHCDFTPYYGWLIGYDHLTLQQTSVFNTAPNGSEAALWASGGAPAADAQGNIFFAVANGTFDTALNSKGLPAKGDFGNAFLKLQFQNGHLTPVDYWTMYNSDSESNADIDLGSGGMMLLPDVYDSSGGLHHLAVGAGKDGNLYVINRDNMGKYDASFDGTIYEQLTGALPGGVWGNPAYFNQQVYFGPQGNRLAAFAIENAKLAPASRTSTSYEFPGATPSVSAFGSANGIVWAVENSAAAVLHAYDASNLANELYNSSQAGGRDSFGSGNKFIAATVADGQVFVGTQNSVGVFGVLPALTLTSGTYTLTNQMSTLVLDDPGWSGAAGSQMIQWITNGGANQKWVFTAKGAGYYTIRNASSGLYLADPGASQSPGVSLEQLSGDGSNSQLWWLTTSGSGYVFHNKASGLVIDDAGLSQKQGNGIVLWTPNGGSNQVWVVHVY